MIEIRTEVQLTGISGKKVSDFLLHCTDSEYQNWWPGTHLAWHTKKQFSGELGNVVYFDEYVGKRRLQLEAVVVQYTPGKQVTWQMKKFVRLPAWVVIELEDNEEGTMLIHSLKAGYLGLGSLLDGVLKLFFSKQFENDMDKHAQMEFRKLAMILM